MKKIVTLLVLFASFSALANDLCNRCLQNCTKDKVTCREFICANRCEGTSSAKSEITVLDRACFEYYREEEGDKKAAEMCQVLDPELEIDYKDLID